MNIRWEEIKLVLFDLDGTLNDTDEQYVRRLVRLLQFTNRIFPDWNPSPFARKTIMALESPGNAIFGIQDIIGIDGLVDQLSKKIGKRKPPKTHHFLPIPGVIPLIQQAAKKRAIGIASVRGSEILYEFLRQTGIAEYVSLVVDGFSTKYTKPHPDPIWYACKLAGVEPSECVMVGDTTVDIKTGKNAGAHTVGVLCGFGTEKELVREGADLIVTSTADLIDFLN